ncbi:ABC transporter substrate-binding protein [Candidatus Sumerlaeota bacterium]|nr:ABC transporter substrate-binding protein [Candidatus Sumerlaeota bacterium]
MKFKGQFGKAFVPSVLWVLSVPYVLFLPCPSPAFAADLSPAQAIPARVVSLAPNLTEMIYALGEENRLVGVTPYCKFPPEAQQKPKVGALVSVDYEKLRSLRPDLVVLLPGQAEKERKINQLGIKTATFRTETIEDIYAAMSGLGKALDCEAKASDKIKELTSRVEAIKAEAARGLGASSPDAPRPRVLFVIGRNPGSLQQIYVCGSGNYLNEILGLLGLENVMKKTALPWPVVGKEAIIKFDPDLILDGSIRQGEAPVDGDQHMRAWDQLEMLKAVKNRRVIAVKDEQLLLVGPGFADGAERLLKLIRAKTGN